MKEEAKSLANESQLDTALHAADKNREKIKNLQTFDSCYFNGGKYFVNDGSQNYLIFQPIFKSSEIVTGSIDKFFWKEI